MRRAGPEVEGEALQPVRSETSAETGVFRRRIEMRGCSSVTKKVVEAYSP